MCARQTLNSEATCSEADMTRLSRTNKATIILRSVLYHISHNQMSKPASCKLSPIAYLLTNSQ